MIEVLTGLLVVLTGLYAYLTHRIAQANQSAVATMREQITASVRPYVYFDLVPHGVLVEARLRNNGVTAAHNVSITTEPQLRTVIRATSEPAKLTHHPTALLAPGRELFEFIGSWRELEESSNSLSFKGALSYSDSSGRTYKEEFRVDLSVRGGMAYIGRPDSDEQLKAIADTLTEISRQLDKHLSKNDRTA